MAATPNPDPNAGRVSVEGKPLSSYPGNQGGSPQNDPNANRVDITGNLLSTGKPPQSIPTPQKDIQKPITPTPPAILPRSAGPDSGFSKAQDNLTPGAAPTEDDFFGKVYQHIAPVIDSINQTEAAAEQAAMAAGSKEQTDLNATLGGRGLGGSSAAARLGGQVNMDTAAAVAAAKKNQSDAISSTYQFLTGQAYSEYKDALSRNDTLSENYVGNMKAAALSTIKGLAENGITSGAELQEKNPQAYLSLLQYYDNDPAALDSALVLNQPNNKVLQSWTQGSTYYQLVSDPITGQPKVQKLDTGINIPTSWQPNKVGTTTLLMQDPSNPANSVTYTTNPFTGAVTASGSGTGQEIADAYNKAHPTDDSTAADNGGDGSGSAAINVSQALGVDAATPLSDVIANVGIGNLVGAIVQNEGGSPAGVSNNPGNVKFTGLTGQTDSGVKAADGGTFASYATPEAGQQAIAEIVNGAAAGSSSSYGSNPTLGTFMGTYTNTGSNNQDKGSNGLPAGEYGLLANVPGFNPSTPGKDQAAYNYLTTYLGGSQPTYSGIFGRSGGAGSMGALSEVADRAREVYYKATGQALPNQKVLQGNLKLIVGNNALKNKLQVQSSTIGANFGLNLKNLDSNNINQNAPVINGVLDSVINGLGDPDVAQYVAQNATLQNELGSLLALKNASGTTVADKLEASGLLPTNASADQQLKIYKTLLQEAQNADTAVQLANVKLYADTDPLQVDPGNPLNGDVTLQNLSTGETRNFTAGSLQASDLEEALNSGYVMTQ